MTVPAFTRDAWINRLAILKQLPHVKTCRCASIPSQDTIARGNAFLMQMKMGYATRKKSMGAPIPMHATSRRATEDDCSCVHAILPYDCNGDCLSDQDGDGICDEFEIEVRFRGVQLFLDATDDDGSCGYCCANSSMDQGVTLRGHCFRMCLDSTPDAIVAFCGRPRFGCGRRDSDVDFNTGNISGPTGGLRPTISTNRCMTHWTVG